MITENDVVNAMVSFLKGKGYEITQALSTDEHRVDIIAKSSTGINCFIEAKGGTSSKEGTNRYGKPFNKSQVFTHISVALTKSLQAIQNHSQQNFFVGIALPKDQNHFSLIGSINKPLKQIGIKVYFVDETRTDVEYI